MKGLVFFKQNSGSLAKNIIKPFGPFWRFLFSFVILPTYRIVFFGRRQFFRFYGPAKNKFLFLFSNRYIFHAAIVGIAAVTSIVNIQASEVRAESYGTKSLLFQAIGQDDSEKIEEVSSDQMTLIDFDPVNYSESFVLSAKETDFDLIEENQVATVLGGSAIAVPAISGSEKSVAARTSTEEYTVQEGDILGTIAENFGLKLNSLLWANNLTYRSTIKPGLKLIIPPVDGVIYTVKKGDTVSGIAKKYNTTPEKILSFNNLSDEASLKISSTLILPDAEPLKSTSVRYTAPASSLLSGSSGQVARAAATGEWIWPTDSGCDITVYFHQYYIYGLHTGLDIDGDYSTTIYAAHSGTVSRASWNGAYGNCIDINNGDGYKTRYGHLSKFYVSPNDVVNAGDPIGKMGTTGKSTGTHLHFEVMDGSTKENPLNFIQCK